MLKEQVPEDYGIYFYFKKGKKRSNEELLINFKDVGSFYFPQVIL